MKEIYTTPEMEIIRFDAEDVITTTTLTKGNDVPEVSGAGDIKF